MYYQRLPLPPQSYTKDLSETPRLSSPDQSGVNHSDQCGNNISDRLFRWFHIGSPTHGLNEEDHLPKANPHVSNAQLEVRRRCRSQPPQRRIGIQKPLHHLPQCISQQMANDRATFNGHILLGDVERTNRFV